MISIIYANIIGVVLGIVGTTLLALNFRLSKWAYPVMFVGSAVLCVYSIHNHDMPQTVLWLYYTFINILGIERWIINNKASLTDIVAAARTAREILNDAPELNMGNYTEDDVSALNDGAATAFSVLDDALKGVGEDPVSAREEQWKATAHELATTAAQRGEALEKMKAERDEYRDLHLPMRDNSYKVEQKKRLRAEAALRAIAKKGDGAMLDIEAIKALATTTLDISP